MTHFVAEPTDGAAWITGASTGIGKEVALRLADEGFTVYISARSEDKLKAVAEGYSGKGKIVALPLNVRDREANQKAVERIVKEAGGLALVMFNAGTFKPVRGFNLNYASFDDTMDINFNGVVNGLLPSVDAMKEAGKGQVAIVSSVAGYGGLLKSASYGASKAALINMAESLKFDLDKMNIKIQVINPGFVDTPMTEKNDFPMPFLMSVEDAADRVVSGFKKSSFEITFPKRFTYILKAINLLPYSLYFALVGRQTGGGDGNKEG